MTLVWILLGILVFFEVSTWLLRRRGDSLRRRTPQPPDRDEVAHVEGGRPR